MYNNIPTKVLTGEVRLSYVNLVEPRTNSYDPSGIPKYSVTLLIPKTDTAVKQNMDSSIEAVAKEAQGKLWNGVRPPAMPIPIHDGDGVRDNGTPYGPNVKGIGCLKRLQKINCRSYTRATSTQNFCHKTFTAEVRLVEY